VGSTTKRLLGLLIAFVLGVGASAYVTFAATMRVMVDRAVERDAVAVRRYVDVLEAMRSEDTEGATELLESWLDDVLIVVMEPSNFDQDLEPITVARADSAYSEARAYREAFPRTSSRPFVDSMVAAVWAAGPPGAVD